MMSLEIPSTDESSSFIRFLFVVMSVHTIYFLLFTTGGGGAGQYLESHYGIHDILFFFFGYFIVSYWRRLFWTRGVNRGWVL